MLKLNIQNYLEGEVKCTLFGGGDIFVKRMKSSTRVRTTISTTRSQHGTDIPSPKDRNAQITQDDINDLKLKTQQLELERRQLKSKTAHARSVIRGRNQSLNSVVNQTADKQNIKTASKNTIASLKQTVRDLESTLSNRKNELDKLLKSDKLAISEELQVEIQILYLEQKRLMQQTRSMKESEAIISGELNRLRRQAASTPSNEEAIDRLQAEIDELTEKLFMYSKNELRVAATKKLMSIHNEPEKLEEEKQKIEAEIESERQKIENNQKLLEKEQKLEEENIAYLQNVIDEQAQAIQEALDENNQKNQKQ